MNAAWLSHVQGDAPDAGEPGGREGGVYTVLLLGMLRVLLVARLSSQSKALAQRSPGEDPGKRREAERTETMGSELPGK